MYLIVFNNKVKKNNKENNVHDLYRFLYIN